MYLPPRISSLNSRERQRDLLARADRHRPVHQLSERASSSVRPERAGLARPRRLWAAVAALIRLLPRYRVVR
jgi:hypothetical protein